MSVAKMSGDRLTKMVGYLEKRGKLSIMGRWKKWWCVLEGQLLLYYKSRIDYANLSPCCGSLNIALVRNVQPHINCQIHIVTHTQLIVLRTKNKEKQQQWFHALVSALPQNSYLSPLFYFSTNTMDCRRKSERKKRKFKTKYFCQKFNEDIPNENSSRATPEKSNDSFNYTSTSTFEARMVEIPNTSTPQKQIRAENVNISKLLQYSIQQNTTTQSSIKCSSEISIRRYFSYQSINHASLQNDETINRRSISCECIFKDYRVTSVQQYEFSNSWLKQNDEVTGKNENTNDDKINTLAHSQSSPYQKFKKEAKRNGTLSKRSFSFFKKIFKNKPELLTKRLQGQRVEKEEIDEKPTFINELPQPDSSVSNIEERNSHFSIRTETDDLTQNEIEEITIYNHFIEDKSVNTDSNNDLQSELSVDTNKNNIRAIQVKDELPDLPVKNGNRVSNISYDFDDIHPGIEERNYFENKVEPTDLISVNTNTNMELDSLLQQLTALNNECDKSHHSLEFNNNIIEDPDYDIPRPHTSLISETDSNVSDRDRNYLDHLKDVLSQRDSLPLDMAPDSLEMPWLLNDTACNFNYWTTKKEFNLCLENDSGSEYDYHDSLNSNGKFYSR